MGAAFPGVDVVGKGKNVFGVGVVILKRHLCFCVIIRLAEKERRRKNRDFVLIDVLHESNQAGFVMKLLLVFGALVCKNNG